MFSWPFDISMPSAGNHLNGITAQQAQNSSLPQKMKYLPIHAMALFCDTIINEIGLMHYLKGDLELAIPSAKRMAKPLTLNWYIFIYKTHRSNNCFISDSGPHLNNTIGTQKNSIADFCGFFFNWLRT